MKHTLSTGFVALPAVLSLASCTLMKATYMVAGGDDRPELRQTLQNKQMHLLQLKQQQRDLRSELASARARRANAQKDYERAVAHHDQQAQLEAEHAIRLEQQTTHTLEQKISALHTEIRELESIAN